MQDYKDLSAFGSWILGILMFGNLEFWRFFYLETFSNFGFRGF